VLLADGCLTMRGMSPLAWAADAGVSAANIAPTRVASVPPP
jgi:hypothetical protein